MMKGLNAYLRRTLSFALAVCMVMSMTLPAMAEGEEGDAPCTHPNAHFEVTKEASCTEAGHKRLVCSCGEVLSDDVIPATGHTFGDWSETQATCETDGVKTRQCSQCEATETETIPAPGHDWGEWTANDDGTHSRACSRGDETQTEAHHFVVNADDVDGTVHTLECTVCGGTKLENHNLESYSMPATCTSGGIAGDRCTVCDYRTAVPESDALGHDWGEWTANADGTHSRECSRCHDIETEAHTPADDPVVTAPTCTEGGYTTYHCTTCGAAYTGNPTPPTHNYVKDEERSEPGNCQSGYDFMVCSRCHDEIRVNNTGVDAHSWDAGEVLVQVTCQTDGLIKYTCDICGATKTENVEKSSAAHVYNTSSACFDAYCVYCNAVKTGTHSFYMTNDDTETVSSCESHDERHYHDKHTIRCYNCDYTYTRVFCGDINGGWGDLTSNGNSWNLIYNGNTSYSYAGSKDSLPGNMNTTTIEHTRKDAESFQPTCGVAGQIVYSCNLGNNCPEKDKHIVVLPATGRHNYAVSRTESTCTVQGNITYTCTACGHSRVDTLALASHNYNAGEYVVTKEPTCSETGLKHLERKCSGCNDVISEPDITVDALGHKAKTGIQENFVNATCTAVGGFDTVSVCETCNKELSREHTTIPALGHAAGALRNAKLATEDAEGYTGDVVCPRCNETLTAGTTIPRLSTGENVEIEPEIILEVLDSEIKLDTAAVEDLTVLAQENGNNALELLTTVNGTMNALELELRSGRITPAEYARCVEVANVAVSVALTVGAKAGSAAQEAAKQNENLPADSDLDMGAIVGEFYQRQFDAILGKGEPTVKSLSSFDGDMSDIKLIFVADANVTASGIDLSIDPEVYRSALTFIDDSVDKMNEAAATLRSCSGEAMVASVKQYIEKVAVSVFRDFDKEAADEEFLQNAYEAILLNMQQQVSTSLTEAYEEASKSGKFTGTAKTELDSRYEEQMAAVADVEVFEIMVLEVMRQKYVSVLNTQLESGIITREAYDAAWETAYDVESFEPIYWAIFRAWALNEESEYPMTLQELTDATIADTTYATTHIEMRDGLSGKEIAFFTGAAVLALLLSAGYILTNSLGKRKVVA